MSLTVDERHRLASWEDLEAARTKLAERERKITAREQAVHTAPPTRDLAWDAEVRRREAAVTADLAANKRTAEELAETRKTLKQERESQETKATQVEAEHRHLVSLRLEVDQTLARAAALLTKTEARDQETRAAVRTHQLAVTAWAERKAAEERALRARQHDLDAQQAAQTAEARERHAALDHQQVAQTAKQAALDQLEALLVQERSPALERREQAIATREQAAEAREQALTAREQVCADQEAAFETERHHLASARLGIEERDLAVTKRERTVARLVEKHKLADEVRALEGEA